MPDDIRVYLEDTVPAQSQTETLSPIVPRGGFAELKLFGGMDPKIGDGIDSIVALYWGDSEGGWETIRAVAGTTMEFQIDRTLTGDGVKRLRMVRYNRSLTNKILAGWIEAAIS